MNWQECTKRAMDIGDAAADHPPGPQRYAYINKACGGDSQLEQQVLDYLKTGDELFLESTADPDFFAGEQSTAPLLLQSLLGGDSANIAPGTRLGPYEVIALIGEGGMGKVYKALDTRLTRFVALKVSKTEFTARFALEAKAAASLNHSNICTLHDIGPNYLVMEYVEGSPLTGPMSVDRALRYAIQICSALDAAHRKGITHRDLKPDNILVTKSGVKLLDFGLAKFENPKEEPASGSPVADTLTGQYEIIGTLSYMSPEQLRGKSIRGEIDPRSDIFAFGLVLYELLIGKRAFGGEVPADIIAAVLERPTPSIAHIASPALDRAFQRCLEKHPDERWQTAHDLKAELEWIAGTPQVQLEGDLSVKRRIASYAPWLFAGICMLGLMVLSLYVWSRSPAAHHSVIRATLTIPGGTFVAPVISRDGTRLLYGQVGIPPRLWLRMMDEMEAHPVPGTEGAESGSFSPDGHWIVFLKGPPPYKLAKVPITGGPPAILAGEADFVTTPFWADDDSILVGSGQGLMRVPAAGGRPESLTRADRLKGEIGHFEPVPLPGGRGILFTVGTGSSFDAARDSAHVAVLDLASKTYEVLQNPGSTPNYVPTGHLVYRRGATLFALPFDSNRLKVTGTETSVLDGLTVGLVAGAGPYTYSSSGTLVYHAGKESRESTTLVWMDRKGLVQPLPEAPHPWQTVPLSPDGRKLVGQLPESGDGTTKDTERIWIHDLDHNLLTPLTSSDRDFSPIWTPDGRSVTFGSNREGQFGIYQMPADSSRQPKLLTPTEYIPYPYSWTPDGRTLVYYQLGISKNEIFLLPMLPDGNAGTPLRFSPQEPSSELQPVVSPDGKWLAYSSDRSGGFEIWVSPFPGPGARFRVSSHGGRLPKWSKDGKELFYSELNPRRLMAVEISTRPVFQSGTPKPLFIMRNDGKAVYFDVAPDGKRFLVTAPPQGASSSSPPTTFVVVTDWFEELSRRLTTRL